MEQILMYAAKKLSASFGSSVCIANITFNSKAFVLAPSSWSLWNPNSELQAKDNTEAVLLLQLIFNDLCTGTRHFLKTTIKTDTNKRCILPVNAGQAFPFFSCELWKVLFAFTRFPRRHFLFLIIIAETPSSSSGSGGGAGCRGHWHSPRFHGRVKKKQQSHATGLMYKLAVPLHLCADPKREMSRCQNPSRKRLSSKHPSFHIVFHTNPSRFSRHRIRLVTQ